MIGFEWIKNYSIAHSSIYLKSFESNLIGRSVDVENIFERRAISKNRRTSLNLNAIILSTNTPISTNQKPVDSQFNAPFFIFWVQVGQINSLTVNSPDPVDTDRWLSLPTALFRESADQRFFLSISDQKQSCRALKELSIGL